MSKREDDAFQGWVDELSKQVEDDEKEDFEAWAKTKSARESFRGYLREAEFHRRLNDLQAKASDLEDTKQQLKEWFEEEKPKNENLLKEKDTLAAERDALKKQLEELGLEGPPPAAATPGPSLSAEDLAELKAKAAKVDVLDRLIPAALGEMGKVIRDSIKNDFDIDPDEVMNLSLQKSVTPWRAYEILTQDERQKRYEADREAERKKWFEEGRRAAQASPSPDHLQPSGPSVVDYLQSSNTDPKKAEQFSDRSARIAAALKELQDGNL